VHLSAGGAPPPPPGAAAAGATLAGETVGCDAELAALAGAADAVLRDGLRIVRVGGEARARAGVPSTRPSARARVTPAKRRASPRIERWLIVMPRRSGSVCFMLYT
jgi:hypothetical protein